jgi:fructose-specific phosphotransferase system IIA component
MLLADILQSNHVKVPLAAIDKTTAIKELVELLAKTGDIQDVPRVLDSVLQREATRTTGVGYGLAIPHSKCPAATHLTMAVGKPVEPIDFQSIDGQPVFLIVLLVSPPKETGAHIQALAKISRLMTLESFRSNLRQCPTSQAVYDAIVAQEKNLAVTV